MELPHDSSTEISLSEGFSSLNVSSSSGYKLCRDSALAQRLESFAECCSVVRSFVVSSKEGRLDCVRSGRAAGLEARFKVKMEGGDVTVTPFEGLDSGPAATERALEVQRFLNHHVDLLMEKNRLTESISEASIASVESQQLSELETEVRAVKRMLQANFG